MFGTNVAKIKVGGMMCDHCVSTVKKTLEAIPGIKSVEVELKTGQVTIKHKGEFPLETVKKALEEADYSFEGVLA